MTTLPEGVYYTKVAQKGRSLNLQGVAQSNARVSSLMRNLDTSTWLTNPLLREIKKRTTDETSVPLSDFILDVSQTQPKKEGEGKEQVAKSG